MRKSALFVLLLACSVLLPNFASAQQGDATIGFGALMSPGAAACNTNTFTCPEKGGLYMNIGADVILHKRVGFGFDANWRASQGAYGGPGGQPFRPILLAFNGIYQPKLGKKAGLDFLGGIGLQSTRFYSGQYVCSFYSCTNFTSSHHFLVDLGAGVRYYVWGHVFVRPEIRYYKVFNNDSDFTSGNLVRAGASIGYTIGPE